MHVVLEVQSTEVASCFPKKKTVADVPTPNPVPVMVTAIPPAVDPVLGATPVTVGSTNLKLSRRQKTVSGPSSPKIVHRSGTLAPSGVVTVTLTLPTVSPGEMAVIESPLFTVKLVALT